MPRGPGTIGGDATLNISAASISTAGFLYGAIDNTFNTPPPSVPSSVGDNAGGQNYQLQVYDGLGRQFRVGLRFTY